MVPSDPMVKGTGKNPSIGYLHFRVSDKTKK